MARPVTSSIRRRRARVAASLNSAPTDIALSATSIAESASIGAVVATISGTDPQGGTLTFSKVADPDSKFTVTGTQLLLAAALDFETKTSHSVTIRATETGGLTYDETFTITVTDVDEAPASALQLNGDYLVLNGTSLAANTLTLN